MAPQTRPPVSANNGDRPSSQPLLYKVYGIIMTPLIFVSFIVSLAVVDFRYRVLRSRYHAEQQPGDHDAPGQEPTSLTPRWLHRLLFRYRPYQYVLVDEKDRPVMAKDNDSSVPSTTIHSRWGNYYHSKQRKLMRMEAADAFEIRSTVLVFLGVLSLCIVWGLWRVLAWGYYATFSRGWKGL